MSELSFKCNKKTIHCLLAWMLCFAMLFGSITPAQAAGQKGVQKNADKEIMGDLPIETADVPVVATKPNSGGFDLDLASAAALTTEAPVSVTVTAENPYALVKFTPSETGIYRIYSVSTGEDYIDPYGTLYVQNTDAQSDEKYVYIQEDDDSAGDRNFAMHFNMEKGKTYVVRARNYNMKDSGTFQICVETANAVKSITVNTQNVKFYGSSSGLRSEDLKATITYEKGSSETVTFYYPDSYFRDSKGNEFHILTAENGYVNGYGTYTVKVCSDAVWNVESAPFTLEYLPLSAYPNVTEIVYGQSVNVAKDAKSPLVYKFQALTNGNMNQIVFTPENHNGDLYESYYNEDGTYIINRKPNKKPSKNKSGIKAGSTYYILLGIDEYPTDVAQLSFKLVGNYGSATAPNLIGITGIALDKTSATMTEGETLTLNAAVLPADATMDKTVSWTSSDPSVASVGAGGVVTALKAGQTTITATTVIGKKTASCVITVAAKQVQETSPTPAETAPTVGQEVKDDKKSDAKYEVSSAEDGKKEVIYTGTTDNKAKKISIPDKITVGGVEYAVTKVDDGAFKNNKKITTVTTGKNITAIGKDAFKGCSALKTVTLNTKTQKIGSNAFNGCKKLKTITIKSTKLTDKTIDKKAFKGISKNTTIKVPKAKLKQYKTLFKKKGLAKNVKVKAI